VGLPLVYQRDDRRHRCGVSLVDVVIGSVARERRGEVLMGADHL
jgi:hypothetical protein